MNKIRVARFSIDDMLPIALTLVVTGIGIAYGLSVMGDTKADFCDNSYDGGQCRACLPTGATTYRYNFTDDLCHNTSALGGTKAFYLTQGSDFNATVDGIEGISKIPEKMPLIVNVVIAAIIIGILVRYLMIRFG